MVTNDTDRGGCPYCGDTSAPITSHYPPFCNLYHKEKFQDQIRYDEADTDRERASVDPRVSGLFVVALGLVMVGLVVATGAVL